MQIPAIDFESQLHICRFDRAEELTTLKMWRKDHKNDSCGRLFGIRLPFFYSSQFVLLVDLWLVRLLTAKAPSPNFV